MKLMAERFELPDMNERLARLRQATETQSLRTGGGGPYDGDMERRIGNLENDMREVRSDLTGIKVQLAKIDAKLDSKIDYKWLTIYVLGIIAVVLRNEIAALFGN
jgi:hypothetical protein